MKSRRDDYTVLLVEDSATDVLLLQRAFRKANVLNPLRILGDGEQAIRYLAGEAEFADRAAHPLPALVLLDLKLPRRSGFEVIEWARAHQTVRPLPIVVLTSSKDGRDVDRAYRLGANTYLVKPVALKAFVDLVDRLHGYWLRAEKPTLGGSDAA